MRVLVLQHDKVESGAIAALLEQLGHQVVKVVHDLEAAIPFASTARCDFALLERELGDGTDATPVAELLSQHGIPYAFIVAPGDPIDPDLFPHVPLLRRPLTPQAIEPVLGALSKA